MNNQPQNVTLTQTIESDLAALFQFQLDKEAVRLAAFTSEDPTDKTAYIVKFTKLLSDSTFNMQTIKIDETIVGSIAKFIMFGSNEITYWIDKNYWGKGVATTALNIFLKTERNRPIYGRVAFDNLGSQKVLERNGFVKVGEDFGFANARQTEIKEFIYKLSN